MNENLQIKRLRCKKFYSTTKEALRLIPQIYYQHLQEH